MNLLYQQDNSQMLKPKPCTEFIIYSNSIVQLVFFYRLKNVPVFVPKFQDMFPFALMTACTQAWMDSA